MTSYWRCNVCGYVHQGDTAPMICPKCGVGAEEFEPMKEEKGDDDILKDGGESDWLLDDYHERDENHF